MEFILASGNAHKASEFAELFDPKIIKVMSAPSKLEVIEDGNSYFENALIKARAYYNQFKVPVLADDSGLNVEALIGEMGIHSARFGGEGLTDSDRAHLLLEKMKDKDLRGASFSCVLCFYLNEKEIFYFEGRLNGAIGFTYRGDGGFGYDPIFIPNDVGGDQTLAELNDWKQKNSHRSLAAQYAQKFFANRA